MAKSVRIEFISQGFHDILCSSGTYGVVDEVANSIASHAENGGGEYSVDVVLGGYGGGRYVGFVATDDQEAREAEAVNKSLSSAVHA